ncbi:D-2-hydroxyacid dehydrogenase [Tardiphaga sp.]|uniref:D-2-hydroxyacid dehydrogenase n=1 Tax=Tardiphaga sp. TaxID=1926292 RepID=UPI0037D99B51
MEPTVAFACKFGSNPFPRAAFTASPHLEWLSIGSSGVDHVVPWDDNKIIVTNASGVAADEMAQYVIGAIFGLYQSFPYFAKCQAAHSWKYRLIRSATGARVGLVGLGHTGEAIAKLCRSVGLQVVACRSTGHPSEHVDRVYTSDDLHAMLAAVDVTVVCSALTPSTRDIIDSAAFSAMRKGSYFINVARGGIVVEDALIAALHTGHLSGAVLDVTRTEPLPASSPLWDSPNLLITPHTSSEFEGWQARAAMMFADNLDRWLRGETLRNRVYSDRGY